MDCRGMPRKSEELKPLMQFERNLNAPNYRAYNLRWAKTFIVIAPRCSRLSTKDASPHGLLSTVYRGRSIFRQTGKLVQRLEQSRNSERELSEVLNTAQGI